MKLSKHTRANKEFFETGHAPSVHDWVAWIEKGCVRGKIIDGEPWVDLNYFAANDILRPAPAARPSGLRLLE